MDKNILVYFYPYLRIIHQAWNWPLAWVFQCRISSLAKKWPYSTSSSNWPYVVISSMQQNHVALRRKYKKSLPTLFPRLIEYHQRPKNNCLILSQKKLDVFFVENSKSIQPFPATLESLENVATLFISVILC